MHFRFARVLLPDAVLSHVSTHMRKNPRRQPGLVFILKCVKKLDKASDTHFEPVTSCHHFFVTTNSYTGGNCTNVPGSFDAANHVASNAS